MRDRQQKSLSMRPSAFDIYNEIYPNLTFFVIWNQKYKFWRLKIHNRKKKISLTNRPNDLSAIIQIILSHKITLCEKQIEIDIGVYFKKNLPFHWVANCKVDHWVSEFFFHSAQFIGTTFMILDNSFCLFRSFRSFVFHRRKEQKQGKSVQQPNLQWLWQLLRAYKTNSFLLEWGIIESLKLLAKLI